MAYFRINAPFFRLPLLNTMEETLTTKTFIAFLRMLHDSANGVTYASADDISDIDTVQAHLLWGLCLGTRALRTTADHRYSLLEWMKENACIAEASKIEDEQSEPAADDFHPTNDEAIQTIETEHQGEREDFEEVQEPNSIQNLDEKPQHRRKKHINTQSNATTKKRSHFRFSMIGLKPGDEIYYKNDPEIKVKIYDDSKVMYENAPMTLSGLAGILMGRINGHLPGPSFFCYEGKTLEALRLEAEKQNIHNRGEKLNKKLHVSKVLHFRRNKQVDTELDTAIKKRPRFRFSMAGLEPGDDVYYKNDPDIIVKIHDNQHVLYKNSPMTLSKLAAILHNDPKGTYRGSRFFCYDGQTLDEIRTLFELKNTHFDDL